MASEFYSQLKSAFKTERVVKYIGLLYGATDPNPKTNSSAIDEINALPIPEVKIFATIKKALQNHKATNPIDFGELEREWRAEYHQLVVMPAQQRAAESQQRAAQSAQKAAESKQVRVALEKKEAALAAKLVDIEQQERTALAELKKAQTELEQGLAQKRALEQVVIDNQQRLQQGTAAIDNQIAQVQAAKRAIVHNAAQDATTAAPRSAMPMRDTTNQRAALNQSTAQGHYTPALATQFNMQRQASAAAPAIHRPAPAAPAVSMTNRSSVKVHN